MLKFLQVLTAVYSFFVVVQLINADDPEQVSDKELKRIIDLNGQCEGSVCSDFQYGNRNEIAYFDLKAEVRINEESTYDIIYPIKYDYLVFENSTFANFPMHLFYTFDIRELDMRNCSIETLTWESFLMAGNLKVLLLSGNGIRNIDRDTFKFASKLQYLFLDGNRIRTLDSDSFNGLTDLRFLDLHENRLQTLPEGIFDTMTLLQEVNLAQNRLKRITNEIFKNNPNLRTINFCENKLREVEEYALKNQNSLQLLDISQNVQLGSLVMNLNSNYLIAKNCSLYRLNIYGPVKNVDLSDNQILELYFSRPESLETLNLRNNALQQIASLTRAKNMRELDLRDNPDLGTLPNPWLVSAMERLDISNTGIKQLPFNALLESQVNLKFLNVSHNRIEEIDPRSFRYLQQLNYFYIHGNNWNCFHLRTMMDMLIVPNAISYAPDVYDAEFPGEYVNGIACMYRIIDDNVDETTEGDQRDNIDRLPAASHIIKLQELNTMNPQIEDLQNQMKFIVRFFQEKVGMLEKKIDDLSARLEHFEKLNSTIWNHVTIST